MAEPMTPGLAGALIGVAVVIVGDGCWTVPDRRVTDKGYLRLPRGGAFRDSTGHLRRRQVRIHRFIYERTCGPVPDGMQLDHLCRNRACIRPDHLEVVTSRENTLRGQNHVARQATATHCKRRHAFTPENTALVVRGSSTHRSCRECRRQRQRVARPAA